MRLVFVIVGLLLTALLGGCAGARTDTASVPTARHEVRHARHPIAKKRIVRPQIESPAQALYDDDDDDDDDEVGLAVPASANDPDDASPAPVYRELGSHPLPHHEHVITFSPVTGLGPSAAHPRPAEHPPRA